MILRHIDGALDAIAGAIERNPAAGAAFIIAAALLVCFGDVLQGLL